MGTYEDLKNAIADVIYTNGNNEITGIILQQILQRIVTTIGMNATFAGIATPDTDPGEVDQNVIYIATQPGIYTHFNGQVTSGIGIFSNKSGVWEYIELPTIMFVTYAELVALRNSGKLTPGMLYRITDYITTTVQANTQSAGHPFDIIVLALSESELSEQARAVQSARDVNGYFADSNLSAWQIWYCIDNNTAKFAWADKENGKGVIYRMIDEFNNDCPYDFKNIQYWGRYTFERYNRIEHSKSGSVYQNTIRPYVSGLKLTLNEITFYCNGNYKVFDNFFDIDCHDINGVNNFYLNTFGPACFGISFDESAYSNQFGSDCRNCNIGANFRFNVIEPYCRSLTIPAYCRLCIFEVGCGINMENDETASANMSIQNYRICSAMLATKERVYRGRTYQTIIARDSSGEVKQFCLADIIQ